MVRFIIMLLNRGMLSIERFSAPSRAPLSSLSSQSPFVHRSLPPPERLFGETGETPLGDGNMAAEMLLRSPEGLGLLCQTRSTGDMRYPFLLRTVIIA